MDNDESQHVNYIEEKIFVHEEILPEEIRNYIFSIFESTIDKALFYIRSKCQELIQTVDLQLVNSLCNLLECFTSPQFGFKNKEKIEVIKRFISHAFSFAFIWSIGSTVSDKSRDGMNNLVRDLF